MLNKLREQFFKEFPIDNEEVTLQIKRILEFLTENQYARASSETNLLLGLIKTLKIPKKQVHHIWLQAGFLYREAGFYMEAAFFFESSYKVMKQQFRMTDPQLWDMSLLIGDAYIMHERPDKCLEFMSDFKHIMLYSHRERVTIKQYIYFNYYYGLSLIECKKYSKADKILTEAFEYTLQEKTESKLACYIIFCLGVLFSRRKNLTEAKSYLDKCLRVLIEHDDSKLFLAKVYRELAFVLLRLGKNEECELMLLKSLNLTQETLVDSHIEIARSLLNYGLYYFDQGNIDETKVNIDAAQTMLEKIFLNYHPEIMNCLKWRSNILQSQKEYDKALKNMDQAMKICKKEDGQITVTYADLLMELGNIHYKQKNFKQAFESYRKVAKIYKELYGLHGHKTSEAYLKSTRCALLFEKNTRAAQKLKRAIEGLLVSIEIDVTDAFESFPFKKLAEVLQIYQFNKFFEMIKPKALKSIHESLKKQDLSRDHLDVFVEQKLREFGKPNLKSRILHWLQIDSKKEEKVEIIKE